jgi:outer membrane protein assembly factor BamD (BamD/ComL family)
VVARAPKAAPPEPPPAPAAVVESDGALAARAHSLEHEGRHADAAAAFAELARRGGVRAEAALYELARVQQRYLGQAREALAALAEYERRYPQGTLAREAALTAVEAHLSLGGGEPALRAMDSFLARFGESERAPDVRWLRASLLVDRGECAQAAPDLEALALAGAHADGALFALASCSRAAGQLDQARARLEEYLRRFPEGRHRAEVQAALGESQP